MLRKLERLMIAILQAARSPEFVSASFQVWLFGALGLAVRAKYFVRTGRHRANRGRYFYKLLVTVSGQVCGMA